MSGNTSAPCVSFVRRLNDGRMLFQREGVYFGLTSEDVQEIARLASASGNSADAAKESVSSERLEQLLVLFTMARTVVCTEDKDAYRDMALALQELKRLRIERVAFLSERLNGPDTTPRPLDRQKVRNAIGGAFVEDSGPRAVDDNLAIALCTYFNDRPDCPDEPNSDEHGWKPWVAAKCNAALDAITEAAVEAVTGRRGEETAPAVRGEG